MIINSSQNIQSNPLDSASARRVNSDSRSSSVKPEENKDAQRVQKQQDDAVISQLRARDREVRAHEAAHVSAGGSLVRGGPSYSYQKGPDGRSYAIGGEVQLDVSAVPDDPDATLVKAGIIRNAALAPADPSAQDRRVASNANQLASRARVDIAVIRREEIELSQKQNELESVSSDSSETESSNAGSGESGESSISSNANSATTPASVIPSTRLQSNDVPVAAISAFMATAQSESTPVSFSRFV